MNLRPRLTVMAVLEVLTFTGSEEYISTRGASFEAYPFRPAEGLQRYGIIGSESKDTADRFSIFRGIEHENKQRGYIFAGMSWLVYRPSMVV